MAMRPDTPDSRTSSSSPRAMPSNTEIEQRIQMATSSARAAPGRPPVGKDTRTQLFVGNLPYRVRWQDLKDLFRKAGGTVLRADVSLGPDNRSRGYGTVLLATAEDAGRAIDMFNGYVWQTRTLEVRPDRTPGDLDALLSMKPGVNPAAAAFSAIPYAVGVPSPLHNMSLMSSALPSHPPLLHSLSTPIQPHSITGSLLKAKPEEDEFRPPLSASRSFTFGPSALSRPPVDAQSLLSTVTPAPLGPGGSYQLHSQGSDGTHSSRVSSANATPNTVLVSNLPLETHNNDLKDVFKSAGEVIKAVIMAGSDGRSRGLGTVVYSNESGAERAVELFNNSNFNGRTIAVSLRGNGSEASSNDRSSGLHHDHPNTHPLRPSSIAIPPPSTGFNLASAPQSPYDIYPPPHASYPNTGNVPISPVSTVGPSMFHAPYPPSVWPSASSTTAATNGAPIRGGRSAPGPINLPPAGFPGGPMSPMHLPPITPSMPSFTFMPPQPTPPIGPHFLSPGVGHFSPMGSPGFYAPGTYGFNLAPGAPVHYPGYNDASPYFDMTAATAGSENAMGYFPPMPPSVGAPSEAETQTEHNYSPNRSEPLAPVGLGPDGFPSLSAKPPEPQHSYSGPASTGEHDSGFSTAPSSGRLTSDDGLGTRTSATSSLASLDVGQVLTAGSGSALDIQSSANSSTMPTPAKGKPKLFLGQLPTKTFASTNNASRSNATDSIWRDSSLCVNRTSSASGSTRPPVSKQGSDQSARNQLKVDALDAEKLRRASWTEDGSKRQSILDAMTKSRK